MNFSRALVAILAFPAALSLAACGGGSTGINNAARQQASIRFIAASPDLGPIDISFQSAGTTANTSNPRLISNAAYGTISDFITEPVNAAQVFIFKSTPGAVSSQVVLSCPIPQMAVNNKYTIVVGGTGANNTVQCLLFQDFDYSTPGQYRVHHASPAANALGQNLISFGLTPGTTAATFTAVGAAQFPGTGPSTPQTSFASVGVNPAPNASTPVGFAFGMNAQAGSTVTTIGQINANQIWQPNTTTAPDTANTLPFSGFGNASLFAIDCQGATTPQGTACINGAGIIGSFDSK